LAYSDKILYIAPYKDGTGYSKSAIGNIIALNRVGVDVVPRSVSFTGERGEVPNEILELEKKDTKNCNVIVQHYLPSQMRYYKEFKKNVGIFYRDSSHRLSDWELKARLMDSTIVNFPIPVDISKYHKSLYEPLDLVKNFSKDTTFYYFIGEWKYRKNIEGLLRLFHTKLSNVNTELVIKTSNVNQDTITAMIGKVKKDLRKKDYKEEIVINGYMPEHEMMRLHASCHHLLCTSRAEGWHIPSQDARLFLNYLTTTETEFSKLHGCDFEIITDEKQVSGYPDESLSLYSSFDHHNEMLDHILKIEESEDIVPSYFSYENLGKKLAERILA